MEKWYKNPIEAAVCPCYDRGPIKKGGGRMTADRERRAASPVVLAAAVTALCMVGDSMLYVVLPVHWEEFGLNAFWQAGLLLSVNRFVRLPLNPLVSRLYRRLSARRGMLGAAALACATTAGYGLAGTFWALLALRALWGLAWTFLRLGAYFTVMETADASRRGRAMGLYNGLMRTGSLFGMLLGGFLADSLGTAWTCAVFAAVSLAAFPLILAAVPASARGMAADAAEEDGFSLAAHWRVLAVLAVGTAVAFVYQGMLVSTVSYLVKVRFPEGLALGGLVLGAASLGGVLQAVRWAWEPWLAPFCGWLSDRPGGRKRLFVGTSVCGAACFAALPGAWPPALWLALILAAEATATSLTTVGDAVAADTAAHSARVKVMTLYSMLTDVGAAAGPAAAFLLNGPETPWASCTLAAVLLLAGAALYLAAGPRPAEMV